MALTSAELAQLIGGEASVITDQIFSGINSLDQAEPGEISFLGNLRYAPQLPLTKASVVLVPAGDFSAPEGCLLIQVENPSASFSKVIDHFQKEANDIDPGVAEGAIVAADVDFDPATVTISAGAIIGKGASIGARTVIGSGVVIGRNAQIGSDCVLHMNTSVRERCVLGDRVILQPGAVVGSDGFGFELVDGRHQKVPQVGIVVLEDDVEIGSNSCIDRARFGKTLIGEGSKVDNLVQVAHNVETGKHCLIVSQSGIAGSSKLGNYVTIAAQAGVGGHIEISDQVVLVGRAGATKSLPNPGAYMGMPARPMAKEQRKMAALSRVPKLLEEMRSLKKKLEKLTEE
ncbi:UDP-3-O-(3-hydroxymyristoyl)glucosamine N-acyltransferase [Akkermansiaceae bacterium]|nr:UDP-3-O-(3-hydroxymyristoyl)glucosamine N-acyltransferase [Akkermansiaceae bacterium]MDB4377513.1 UDP-3-O-(3-hydroxymyristoyl)glucosamine N-acyltransferase [Akkermansiaceae bacterium]